MVVCARRLKCCCATDSEEFAFEAIISGAMVARTDGRLAIDLYLFRESREMALVN